MKIELRSIRVVNCGPLKDVQIDFADPKGKPRQTVLLAGANGSGKTTILELILALAEIINPGYPDYEQRYGSPHYDDWADIDSRRNGVLTSILRRAEYAQIDLQVGQGIVTIFYGERPANAELKGAFFGWQPGIPAVLGLDSSPIVQRIRSEISTRETSMVDPGTELDLSPGIDPLPSFLYFPHYRMIPAVRPEAITREEIPYRWAYRYGPTPEIKGSLDSYLTWLDYTDKNRFHQVIELLNGLDFDGKTFSVRKKELKVIVTTRDGGEHYLEDLSSGEQSILITLLELRLRLLPGSIVLIDEIEHSLHPAFQYRIAEGLKRLQQMIPFQLIVTTHAKAFLDIFGAENTLILTEF